MNKFMKFYRHLERIEATNNIGIKNYLIAALKAIALVLFFASPILIVIINTFIMLVLYKSFWAIIIGYMMIYFIVMCLWAVDKYFIKFAGLGSLNVYKKEFLIFYTILASVSGLIGVVFIIIEVI